GGGSGPGGARGPERGGRRGRPGRPSLAGRGVAEPGRSPHTGKEQGMETVTETAGEELVADRQPLYRLEGVDRYFRVGSAEVRAVDNVDLELYPGEFLSIEGPSGSGKSTMLQLLGALDRPTRGTLNFEGEDLGSLSEAGRTRLRREALGFVFQHFNLIPTLTAAENVEAAMARARGSKHERRERVVSLL